MWKSDGMWRMFSVTTVAENMTECWVQLIMNVLQLLYFTFMYFYIWVNISDLSIETTPYLFV